MHKQLCIFTVLLIYRICIHYPDKFSHNRWNETTTNWDKMFSIE